MSSTPAIGQATLLWAVGSLCICGWEWIVCLPREYRCIWTKKPTFVSGLYVVNRYLGLLQLSVLVALMTGSWAPGFCRHIFYWQPVAGLISSILSETILGIHVYALYFRSTLIAFILYAILLVEVLVGGILIYAAVPSLPGVRSSCVAIIKFDGWLVSYWSIPIFFRAITFGLTAWKTYYHWRQKVNSPLISVLWRDGLLYFFSLLIMNIAAIVIFFIAPRSLEGVNLTPTLILSMILSCRIVLNLRSTQAKASQSAITNLTPSGSLGYAKHTMYQNSTFTLVEKPNSDGQQSKGFEGSPTASEPSENHSRELSKV